MAAHDLSGGPAQVAGPLVVTQPGPAAQDGLLAGAGQLLNGGEGAEEALVVGDYHRDARLLEHGLRQPDAVGIRGAAPGEVTAVTVEPAKQTGTQGAHRRLFQSSH